MGDNQDSRIEEYFEELYRRITSEESRAGADALFAASGEDLAESFRPGETETTQ